MPPESDYDKYFERVTRVAARALNLPISVVCLDRLGQPEVIGASGCERDVVFHVETYYSRTLQCEEPFVVRDALSDALRKGHWQPANCCSAFSQALRCVYRAADPSVCYV